MTGGVIGWGIPLPHSNLGHRLRVAAAEAADLVRIRRGRLSLARRDSRPHYPAPRPAMFEEAAMAREMYRL
jgi:hypothetical protein